MSTAEQRVAAYLDALESWMWTWRTAGPVAWIMSGEDQLDLEAADLRAVLAIVDRQRKELAAMRGKIAAEIESERDSIKVLPLVTAGLNRAIGIVRTGS